MSKDEAIPANDVFFVCSMIERESDAILRVYNHPLCDDIDNYNASTYYEPLYYLAQVYRDMLKPDTRKSA